MADATLNPTRADTWRVTVSIDGAPPAGGPTGVWDVMEGGEVDSDEMTYKPGGMAPPISLGGSRNVTNVTLRRNYRLSRDHTILSDFLIDAAGRADVVITQQPLNYKDKKPWGSPIVYKGTLKRVAFPNPDSSSSDAAMIEIEVTIDGFPTADRQ